MTRRDVLVETYRQKAREEGRVTPVQELMTSSGSDSRMALEDFTGVFVALALLLGVAILSLPAELAKGKKEEETRKRTRTRRRFGRKMVVATAVSRQTSSVFG